MIAVFLSDPEQTQAWGRRLGALLRAGDCLLLTGGLGAGKTTLTQAIALGLGLPPEVPVTSPSFSLLHQYPGGRLPLSHLDLYRLSGPEDVESSGLLEYLAAGDEVVVVEWPDRLGPFMPVDCLEIVLEIPTGGRGRNVTLIPHGPGWQARRCSLHSLLP